MFQFRNLDITQKHVQHFLNDVNKYTFFRWLKWQSWEQKTQAQRHCAVSTFLQAHFQQHKTTPRIYDFSLGGNFKEGLALVPVNITWDFYSAEKPLGYKPNFVSSQGDASTFVKVTLPKWVGHYVRTGK